MMGFFQAGKHCLPLNRTYCMGILNVTPDSFSDGGRYLDPDAAVAHALEMQAQGADIIDIGGQSTRPGYEPIPPEEEWARISQVLPAVVRATGLPVSVDTFYPWVAQRALEAGASILNDVKGFGPEMLQVAAGSQCGCVVMDPGTTGGGICARVREFFLDRLRQARALGIDPARLCFDPGIGFGKTMEENLDLLAGVDRTKVEGCAFLMAASRKRVTGIVCGNPPFAERLPATLAAHTAAVLGGADILRVHDVKEAVQAAAMADALALRRWTQSAAGEEQEVPADTIHIKGLRLFAYHGVNPEEKRDGQNFLLDITLKSGLSQARHTDALEDTVNYAAVVQAVQEAFTAASFDLIERAAQAVCDAVLDGFSKVEEVTVLLKKPEATVSAEFDYMAVEVTQRRKEA